MGLQTLHLSQEAGVGGTEVELLPRLDDVEVGGERASGSALVQSTVQIEVEEGGSPSLWLWRRKLSENAQAESNNHRIQEL